VEAGFRQVLIGFESGDPRILVNINKRATVEQNTRCVEICRRNGLTVKALMSIGHPGETLATIDSTHQWLMRVRPDDFDVTIITVYPGTPYFDEACESSPGVWTYRAPKTGDLLHARSLDFFNDVPYYKGVPGAYQAFVWTDSLSAEDLVRERDRVEANVRRDLGIAYPTASAAIDLEHSMGCR
jgi:anaerobic magnesium-protoporphyrin IX monomethyl ester cyclase